MLGTPATLVEINREIFVAELIEATLAAAGKHGTYASSVELEVDLWNALSGSLRDRAHRESLERAEHRWEERLAELTDAAYRVVLHHGFCNAFVDLQIDLRKGLGHVIRRNRFLPTRPSARLSGFLGIR
jgi:hypothetical protein